MKQLQKRLTYANVMSSIAVFLVLGGAAFAAVQLPKNSVGTKQLKKNAVTTAKIKREAVAEGKIKNGAVTSSKLADGAVTTSKIVNDAVTGEKVNESTLGEVPKAAHANTATNATNAASATNANHANTATNATNATNAANANTVGGLSVQKFFVKIPNGGADTTIFSTNGLSLKASCEGGGTELLAVKDTGAPAMTATMAAFNTFADELITEGFSTFSSVDLDQGFPTLGGKFEATTSAGTVITIQYTARDPSNYGPAEDVCVYAGTVISG